MKHFLTGFEFSPAEYSEMIARAIAWKKGQTPLPDFLHKSLTLLFANPSLRTRLSFESGFQRCNGNVQVLNLQGSWGLEYNDGVTMNGANAEHIEEAAQVISRYADVIGFRQSGLMAGGTASDWATMRQDIPHQQLAKYATVPVINMESNMYHPCQAAADAMTMTELHGDLRGANVTVTWAPHIKPLPLATPHSQVALPAYLGANVTLVHPPEFPLDADVLAHGGGNITVTHDQNEALAGADFVIAKSWAPMHHMSETEALMAQYADWKITKAKMEQTNNASFLHCLPVRRGVVVDENVLTGQHSKVINQAENRLWAQLAIVEQLLLAAL